ncbi:hypothetical protein D3C76_1551680 [compost metagenome]
MTGVRTRAPQVGEKGDVVPGAKDVRVHQPGDGQHQSHFEDGAHKVITVIEQRRAMKINPRPTDELPE